MEFRYSDEFERELKKLQRKYRTLSADLAVLKKAIAVEPTGDGSKHWNILHHDNDQSIVKVRLMCRALKGSSMRVIYRYDGINVEVLFIELFYKGDKEREDEDRIKRYLNEP